MIQNISSEIHDFYGI